MKNYSDYIAEMKAKWIGKTVNFEGNNYKVVNVDYNGCLLIDRRARFTETTAILPTMAMLLKG